MYQQRLGARAEYRIQEGQRVRDSITLAEKFRKLKSLTVELSFHNSDSDTKSSQVKYTPNLANARSVFRLSRPNSECIRGDFDLTEELADAVASKRTAVTGEVVCQGWRSRTTIDTVRCQNVLRYKLTLGY